MGQPSSKELPRATIHVLTYNQFDHIYENIDSILAQTYANIEIVIADDGSESFPEENIRNYLCEHRNSNIKNVVILAGKTNVGTVKNQNNAIMHSTGDVYIPLSQDDEFLSEDVVERIMQRYMAAPFNVLITSRYGVNKKGEFLRLWPHYEAREFIEKMNAEDMFRAYSETLIGDIASGSVLNLSAEFCKKMGCFDERYRLWEDGPFFHKCLRRGYRLDTAYDIVSIKYEQTEGVSNFSTTNKYMQEDIDLFLDTDFQEGANDFGYFHRRYIKCFNCRRKWKSSLLKCFLPVIFLDVYLYKLHYLVIIKNWGKYDQEWYMKNYLQSETCEKK